MSGDFIYTSVTALLGGRPHSEGAAFNAYHIGYQTLDDRIQPGPFHLASITLRTGQKWQQDHQHYNKQSPTHNLNLLLAGKLTYPIHIYIQIDSYCLG